MSNIRTCWVYMVTNLVNGKKYVGCTARTVEVRWVEHQNLAKRGSSFALHAAIRKYGAESLSIEVLEEVVGSHADLMAAEVRWISFHVCVAPKGYNFTRGGDGVDFMVPAAREKHLAAVRKSAAEPARQEWFRNRSSNRAYVQKLSESSRRLAVDPAWLAANAAGLAKTRASIHANALARDALLPPEVAARREKHREYYHKRKAQVQE
jgi:group I intron endonuclease